jgi:predicted nucleic acid-binding protein
VKAIADTGFVVAFLHSDDRFHGWALDTASRLDAPMLTCEAVLAEAAFHLRSAEVVLQLTEAGMLRVAFDMQPHLASLRSLAERFANRAPDLADLCLIRMSELFPRHTVVTTDEADFRVYRRNKRDAIPLLCPPRR